jgi:DNA-binding CsgD family transcriptional regulator
MARGGAAFLGYNISEMLRGRSDEVRFDEFQKALQLGLELRELPQGSEVQKRHALQGMAALVGAQVTIWANVDGVSAGGGVIRPAIDLGWSCEAERNAFLSYVDRDQWTAIDPSMPSLARAVSGPMCTFTREQLVDDRAWYRSDHVQGLRRAGRVDSFIYTVHARTSDEIAAFSLHRAWGERQFSERERRLVDLFHRACAFLHDPPFELSPAVARELTPRLRETLLGLARGLSEKQVAAELRLSPHTVHDYVKALHRQFGVQSRGELLARCIAGHRPRTD